MIANSKIIIISFFALMILFCSNTCNTKERNSIQKKDSIMNPSAEKKEDVWTIERCYKENPYDFDTILKNGYGLRFEYLKKSDQINDIVSQLTLVKGEKIIDTLNIMGYGVIMKNLGYIGADFNDYFAFVQSYGSGNPHEMQLLRKKDASEILNGYIVDADEKNELLLYCKGYDSLMIYDINRKTNKLLVNLNKCDYITCMVSQLYGSLKIKNVTQNQVEIEILRDENDTIIKKYNR